MSNARYGRALYYPHIYPRSRAWLRTALLYHDSISRIVPASYRIDRHGRYAEGMLDDIAALEECGFLVPEPPDSSLLEAGDMFLTFLSQTPYACRTRANALSFTSDEAYTMYFDKWDARVYPVLDEMGLARRCGEYEVEMPRNIGRLYMLCLARQMAADWPIITDNPAFEAAGYLPTMDSPESSYDHGFLLARAVFRTVVPAAIEYAPVGELIKFWKDHADERAAFYDEINGMVKELKDVRPGKHLDDAVAHFNSRIHLRLKSLEARLQLINLACTVGIYTLSIPSYWTAEHWGLGITNPFVLAGASSLAVTGVALKRSLERKAISADVPVAYVHEIQQSLTPKAYIEKTMQLHVNEH
jgi:hypothetical protein